jgi:hypothetical protein
MVLCVRARGVPDRFTANDGTETKTTKLQMRGCAVTAPLGEQITIQRINYHVLSSLIENYVV